MRTKPKCPRLAVGLARPTLAPRTKGGHCTVVQRYGNYRMTSAVPEQTASRGHTVLWQDVRFSSARNERAAASLSRIPRVFAKKTTERLHARYAASWIPETRLALLRRAHARTGGRNASHVRTHAFRRGRMNAPDTIGSQRCQPRPAV